MTGRADPWFHCPATGWESARTRLPRPLTREEAIADLRWWERQVRMGRDDPDTGLPLSRMPGRDRLVAEWGWDGTGDRTRSPHQVRRLLASPDLWTPPARHQPDASPAPAGAQSNADNGAKSASRTPAPAQRQPSASASTVQPAFSAEKHQPSASQPPPASPNPAENLDNPATEKARRREATTTTPTPQAPHPVDQLQAQAVTADQRRLLLVLRRWTAPSSGAPHAWVVDWSDVLAWWSQSVLVRPDYAQLDLADQLDRWDNHLERAAGVHGRPGRRGDPSFPKVWKNALHTWLSNAVRYADRDRDRDRDRPPTRPHRTDPPPDHTGPTDHDHPQQPPRQRLVQRRRGQQGNPGLFDLQPRDAGADD